MLREENMLSSTFYRYSVIADRTRLLSNIRRSPERSERWVKKNQQFFSAPAWISRDPPVTVNHTPKPDEVEEFW